MKTSALDLELPTLLITSCRWIEHYVQSVPGEATATRSSCKANGVHCPDYTKDLTIRAMTEEVNENKQLTDKKGKKKTREIRFL